MGVRAYGGAGKGARLAGVLLLVVVACRAWTGLASGAPPHMAGSVFS
jgi:hypothetical protein